ncbi:MAG: hypothetical protein AAF677_11590 [Pseudomonadota bacterium]
MLSLAVAERPLRDGHLTGRIGGATDHVAPGTVGGQGRRASPVYGDPVSVAQQLEQINQGNRQRGVDLRDDPARCRVWCP